MFTDPDIFNDPVKLTAFVDLLKVKLPDPENALLSLN